MKESEEEQMTETFTRFNKKFTQPQQKDISKKNTPRRNMKIFDNDSRGHSREKSESGSNTFRKKLNSRSKSKILKATGSNKNFK